MRIKMYTDVLVIMRRQITTHEIEDTVSGTQETGYVADRTLSKGMKTNKKKYNVSRSRHIKLIEESVSCRMGGIKKENKILCKANSEKRKGKKKKEECNKVVTCKRNPARIQKVEAMKKIASIKDSLKVYAYIF